MSDVCEVYLLSPAEKDFRKIVRVDQRRALVLDGMIEQIEENGWVLSIWAGLIKELRPAKRIGEIRDVGKGGYRLFFCWDDHGGVRRIHITAIVRKSDVVSRARVNAYLDAAEEQCERLSQESDQWTKS